MRVVGLMSGTSYDGIDVAVADLEFEAGTIVLTPLGDLEVPHDDAVRALIQAVLPPARAPLEAVCRLDTLLGRSFAEAAARGIEAFASGRADLVVSHGQTVFHWVDEGRALGSLQLGQPAWIAERTGATVVSDLRARDIAAGGQGAPLVPMFDRLLLPPSASARAALNLGGIANMTVIAPDAAVFGYDLGPGNALIDAAVRRYFGESCDRDGRIAATGRVDRELLAALGDHPYFERPAPKSTGKELFHDGYLAERSAALTGGPGAGADVVATVTEFTARLVVTECRRYGVQELIVSGGGSANPVLMRRIRELGAGLRVRAIDDFGIPAGAKEAYAFALLGFLSAHGVPASVPECTGARTASLLGSLTPGREPFRPPEPPAVAPARLVIRPRDVAQTL